MLANPGHNRVYFETANKLGQAELEWLMSKQQDSLMEYAGSDFSLPSAYYFSSSLPLSEQTLTLLHRSSMFYTLFEIINNQYLQPIAIDSPYTFPENMSQLLKYTGKTNEQFTRMLLNVADGARQTSSMRPTLFDPMCGKGTSLYEGIILGWHVVGIEINDDWVLETKAFLTKYMKNGRYKHKATKEKRTGTKGKKLCDVYKLETAAIKQDFGTDNMQTVQLFNSDTRNAEQVVKKNSCDMVVCDLPYGVQHGSKQTKQNKLDRSPAELLNDALPAWKKPLKSGASIVLAFNEFTLPWQHAAQLLTQHGYDVITDDKQQFLHRVDQAINRNVIVARYK